MKDIGQPLPAQFIRPTVLQEPIDRRIRCLICERRCEIVPGGMGWCQTRRHQQGTLVTLIYGAVSSLSANPIEKKPLYHFYPGTQAFTSGSWSCNFGCPWCQNYHISKVPPGRGCYISPKDFVLEAIALGCQGTSISFNEPTLSLEWSLDVFRLARARGLYNTYVTNGYMTPEALELLVEAGLNAMNVDVKGDAQAVRRYCKGIDVEKVWRNCRLAQALGVHLEITTLVIPGVNDRAEILRGIAQRILAELGPDVPWHVNRYYPAYRFTTLTTPVDTMERAWQIGTEAGLKFVYLGNVLGHRQGKTYCPACGTLLIGRWGLSITTFRLDHGCCPECGWEVPGVWSGRQQAGAQGIRCQPVAASSGKNWA
jgi:pyruvate formate lyase activating enzyme